VDIVALMSLATAVEVEAPLLAADLGTIPYETALLLRGPSPVPLLRTDDRARALDLLAKLRARGHDAVACDASAVVSSDAMTRPRSFRLEADALAFISAEGKEDRVSSADVVALVRAMHRSRSDHIEKTEQSKFSLGRAAMSGGLLMTKKVTTEKVQTSEEREQVLYLFRRGGVPLLFALSRTHYEGLGVDLRPAQIENFGTLVRLLRSRSPAAPYDERLLLPRPAADRVVAGNGGMSSASSAANIDLLAHLIALALSKR
jgi:hypothetical protein